MGIDKGIFSGRQQKQVRKKGVGERSIVPRKNRLPMEKSSDRLSEMESSINVLLSRPKEWHMGQSAERSGKKGSHTKRKKRNTNKCIN